MKATYYLYLSLCTPRSTFHTPIFHTTPLHTFALYSPTLQNLKKPKGVIVLNKGTVVSYSNRKNFCLSVKTEAREYLIQGKSQAEIDEWKQAIEHCVSPSGQHILLSHFLIVLLTSLFSPFSSLLQTPQITSLYLDFHFIKRKRITTISCFPFLFLSLIFAPKAQLQSSLHKKDKESLVLQRYSLSAAALELRQDVIQGLVSILHEHLQSMEPVDVCIYIIFVKFSFYFNFNIKR